jgi:hypothetical protein
VWRGNNLQAPDSAKVHFLTIEGHPDANDETIQQIAVEVFLVGCKDKKAAVAVMDKEPKTIFDAQDRMKFTVNNYHALFGSRASSQRQVTFVDNPEEAEAAVRQASTSPDPHLVKMQEDMRKTQEDTRSLKTANQELTANVKKIQDALATLTTLVQSSTRPTSPASSSPRRSPGSPRSVECYHCHEPGHIRPECPKLQAARRMSPSPPKPHLN